MIISDAVIHKMNGYIFEVTDSGGWIKTAKIYYGYLTFKIY